MSCFTFCLETQLHSFLGCRSTAYLFSGNLLSVSGSGSLVGVSPLKNPKRSCYTILEHTALVWRFCCSKCERCRGFSVSTLALRIKPLPRRLENIVWSSFWGLLSTWIQRAQSLSENDVKCVSSCYLHRVWMTTGSQILCLEFSSYQNLWIFYSQFRAKLDYVNWFDWNQCGPVYVQFEQSLGAP